MPFELRSRALAWLGATVYGMTLTTPDHIAKCRAKVRHNTPEEAKAAGQRRIRGGHATELWVYHCNVCFGYHLTKWHTGHENAVHDPDPFATIVK